MARKIKVSLTAAAVAFAFVAAVAATPNADNNELLDESTAYFLGFMIETT